MHRTGSIQTEEFGGLELLGSGGRPVNWSCDSSMSSALLGRAFRDYVIPVLIGCSDTT